MGIKDVLGKINPVTTKSRLMVVAGVVILIFVMWGGIKWSTWKRVSLEKENQALDIENQSSKQAAKDAEKMRVINQTAINTALKRQAIAKTNSSAIQTQVRDEVTRLQNELSKEKQLLQETRDEILEIQKEKTATRKLKREIDETNDRYENTVIEAYRIDARNPRVVVETLEVPGPSVDARISQRIVDGMWDNYCGQVPDHRDCPSQSPSEGDLASDAAQ